MANKIATWPVIAVLAIVTFGTLGGLVWQVQAQNELLRGAICGVYQPIAIAPQTPGQAPSQLGTILRVNTGKGAERVHCTPNPYDNR